MKKKVHKNTIIKGIEEARAIGMLHKQMWVDFAGAPYEERATKTVAQLLKEKGRKNCSVCAVGAVFLKLADRTQSGNSLVFAVSEAVYMEQNNAAVCGLLVPEGVSWGVVEKALQVKQYLTLMSHIYESPDGGADVLIQFIKERFPTYVWLEIDGLKVKNSRAKAKKAK